MLPLIDKFDRIHDYLRISLTERCNLRCFYCMPENGIELREKSEFMTSEEVFEIAKVFVSLGVKKIRLTGGEPLIKKDVTGIIKSLSALPVKLAITTNGVLIDRFIDEFIHAGITDINVSLDSLNEEKQNKISRRDYFSKVISNIQLLVSHNFHVKLNAVVMKNVNDKEVTDFVELTRNNNIHVRFIEFMPFDGNNWSWEKKVSEQEMLANISEVFNEKLIPLISDNPHDTTHSFKISGFCGTFGIISPVTNPFCDTCNRLRLTADGRLKNCLFSPSETDLLTTFRKNEDIIPLIRDTLYKKHEKRGGITSFNTNLANLKNRSMVSIGG